MDDIAAFLLFSAQDKEYGMCFRTPDGVQDALEFESKRRNKHQEGRAFSQVCGCQKAIRAVNRDAEKWYLRSRGKIVVIGFILAKTQVECPDKTGKLGDCASQCQRLQDDKNENRSVNDKEETHGWQSYYSTQPARGRPCRPARERFRSLRQRARYFRQAVACREVVHEIGNFRPDAPACLHQH